MTLAAAADPANRQSYLNMPKLRRPTAILDNDSALAGVMRAYSHMPSRRRPGLSTIAQQLKTKSHKWRVHAAS